MIRADAHQRVRRPFNSRVIFQMLASEITKSNYFWNGGDFGDEGGSSERMETYLLFVATGIALIALSASDVGQAARPILPCFLLFFGANAQLSCSMANTQTRRKMSVGTSLACHRMLHSRNLSVPLPLPRVTGHESRSSALMLRPQSRHPRSHVSAIFLIFCAEHFSQRGLFIQPHE